ncbi:hypothetical protein [Selenomonas ruminantium]|uniref:hypothetical protein n=1 Tax=Selenomonas ruminantium TaxID=971 RepID=UPI00116141BB|nr:hypothetical protein [Selenomonas ruminantium]
MNFSGVKRAIGFIPGRGLAVQLDHFRLQELFQAQRFLNLRQQLFGGKFLVVEIRNLSFDDLDLFGCGNGGYP